MGNKIGVALTKEVCPVCCKEQDGAIVMNTVLNERNATEVEKLHNQVVGFMPHPCTECREKMPEGTGTWLVIVDEDKSDEPNNPYRTGNIFGMKREDVESIFNVPYSEIAYMDYRVAQHIGIEVKYTP